MTGPAQDGQPAPAVRGVGVLRFARPAFSSAQKVDLEGRVENSADIYFDAPSRRYFVLDSTSSGSLIRVLNSAWEPITECDASGLVDYRAFARLTKMTCGHPGGLFLLYSYANNEIVTVDLAERIALHRAGK